MNEKMRSFAEGILIGLFGTVAPFVGTDPAPTFDYIPVEYIQFDGTQYIDTGLLCTQKTSIETEFMRDTMDAQYLYGANSSDSKASITAYMPASSTGNWRFGGTYKATNFGTGVKYKTIANSKGLTIDGNLNYYGGTVGTFTTPVTLVLGSSHNSSGTYGTSEFYGKIYAFKMYEGDTLVADYVPGVNADGEYGFWDRVTETFRTSDSGTPLSGAPVVTEPRLVSYDGYVLQDANGLYLIPKEGE